MNKTRKYDGKKKCAAAVRMEKLLGLHCPENHKDNKKLFRSFLYLEEEEVLSAIMEVKLTTKK